jgi:hypothetical protein
MPKLQRLRKSLIGHPFYVRFRDHSEGATPSTVEVYGALMSYTRKHIVIRAWNTLDEDASESSQHEWALLRSTLKRLIPLVKAT